MQKLYTLFAIAAIIVTAACSDEDPLTPSEIETMSRFGFPEGDDPCDAIFEDIYREHGVQVIYKNWTTKDWEKTWTDPGSTVFSNYAGNYPENGVADTLTIFAEFVRDDIFAHLSAELSQKVFRPYIYLVNSYYALVTFGAVSYRSYAVYREGFGLDYVLWSPYTPDASHAGVLTGDPAAKHLVRCILIWNHILQDAINKEIITMPAGWMDGMDVTTAISNSDETVADYYMARGFIDRVAVSFGTAGSKPTSTTLSLYYQGTSGALTFFCEYLRMAMYHDEAAVQAKYGNFAPVMDRYNRVTGYIADTYGIDLKAIASR